MPHLLVVALAVVRQHVDDERAAAGFERAGGLGERAPRLGHVVQHEHQHRRIQPGIVATGTYAQLTHGRVASVGSIGSDRVALVIETPMEPAEIYVADASLNVPRKLTDTNPHARSFALGKSEVISWKSDNVAIEGVLLKPVNYQEGKRYPLMVVAHGGPAGAYLDNYRVGYGDGSQNWAGEGWAVLYPNPRGSSNYGEKFLRANINDWGGGDYRDIMAGVDAMIARGIADPDRLGVMGASYGGYMTNWIVTQTGRFKAASAGASLSDLSDTFYLSEGGDFMIDYFKRPWENRDGYAKHSPLTFADRVTTPLLIQHGEVDPRVPIAGAWKFYKTLKALGKTVELEIYPRGGHVLREPMQQREQMRRNLEWFARWIAPGERANGAIKN